MQMLSDQLRRISCSFPLNVVHTQAHRHVPCPTCRQKAQVGDIAYVDAGRPVAKEAGSASAAQREEEEKIFVRGSYSTKVRIPSLPSRVH